jgi:hypothetical protein
MLFRIEGSLRRVEFLFVWFLGSWTGVSQTEPLHRPAPSAGFNWPEKPSRLSLLPPVLKSMGGRSSLDTMFEPVSPSGQVPTRIARRVESIRTMTGSATTSLVSKPPLTVSHL